MRKTPLFPTLKENKLKERSYLFAIVLVSVEVTAPFLPFKGFTGRKLCLLQHFKVLKLHFRALLSVP